MRGTGTVGRVGVALLVAGMVGLGPEGALAQGHGGRAPSKSAPPTTPTHGPAPQTQPPSRPAGPRPGSVPASGPQEAGAPGRPPESRPRDDARPAPGAPSAGPAPSGLTAPHPDAPRPTPSERERQIGAMKDRIPILERGVRGPEPIVVIREDVDGEALARLVVQKLRGIFPGRKAPGFGTPGPAATGGERDLVLDHALGALPGETALGRGKPGVAGAAATSYDARVDAGGHADYVRNMITGASQDDTAIPRGSPGTSQDRGGSRAACDDRDCDDSAVVPPPPRWSMTWNWAERILFVKFGDGHWAEFRNGRWWFSDEGAVLPRLAELAGRAARLGVRVPTAPAPRLVVSVATPAPKVVTVRVTCRGDNDCPGPGNPADPELHAAPTPGADRDDDCDDCDDSAQVGYLSGDCDGYGPLPAPSAGGGCDDPCPGDCGPSGNPPRAACEPCESRDAAPGPRCGGASCDGDGSEPAVVPEPGSGGEPPAVAAGAAVRGGMLMGLLAGTLGQIEPHRCRTPGPCFEGLGSGDPPRAPASTPGTAPSPCVPDYAGDAGSCECGPEPCDSRPSAADALPCHDTCRLCVELEPATVRSGQCF